MIRFQTQAEIAREAGVLPSDVCNYQKDRKKYVSPEKQRRIENAITKPPSQRKRILAYLKTGRTLTVHESIEKFGCERLAGRIHELRKTYNIPNIAPHGKPALYKLEES